MRWQGAVRASATVEPPCRQLLTILHNCLNGENVDFLPTGIQRRNRASPIVVHIFLQTLVFDRELPFDRSLKFRKLSASHVGARDWKPGIQVFFLLPDSCRLTPGLRAYSSVG